MVSGMSDEETSSESPKRNGAKIAVAVVLVLAAGGAGAYFLLFAKHAGATAKAEAAAPAPKARFGPLVELQPLVANLNDPQAGRYVKMTIHLETVDEEAKTAVEAAIVPIRNEALMLLSGITVEETIGAENKQKLSTQLHEKTTGIVGKDVVRRVFFSEFVVQ